MVIVVECLTQGKDLGRTWDCCTYFDMAMVVSVFIVVVSLVATVGVMWKVAAVYRKQQSKSEQKTGLG